MRNCPDIVTIIMAGLIYFGGLLVFILALTALVSS